MGAVSFELESGGCQAGRWKNIVLRRRSFSFGSLMKTFAELGFPGRLIAVEGLDGSGKSTQIYLLKRWLELQGLKVYFSEWNSSELVKAATSKGKKRELLTPTTFSLIHATDFADRLENEIIPALRAGFIVLTDRYIYSLIARAIVRGADPEWLREVYGFALKPDAVFYLRIKIDDLVTRVLQSSGFDYWESGMDMHMGEDMYESFVRYQKWLLAEFDKMVENFGFEIVDFHQDSVGILQPSALAIMYKSQGRFATVDCDRRTRNEGRFLGRQEHD